MRMERIHYLDVAKGILILLLIMSHSSIAINWSGINPDNPNFTLWYYPQPLYIVFFMQCFFIISGLCSNFDTPPSLFFKKLSKQLLVPWLFFEIIRLIFLISQGNTVRLFPGDDFTSLWFLNALFFAKAICWGIHRVTKSIYVMLLTTIAFLILGIVLNEFCSSPNTLCYRHGLIASFFVAVGFVLKSQRRVFNTMMICSSFVFIIIIGGRFLHLYDLPVQDASISVTLSTSPLFVLTSLTGSLAFLLLCRKVNSNNLLEYFGRNSLIIYGLHMWPFVLILGTVSHFIDCSTQIGALSFILVAYICELIAISAIIELLNCRYLKFLIGKF